MFVFFVVFEVDDRGIVNVEFFFEDVWWEIVGIFCFDDRGMRLFILGYMVFIDEFFFGVGVFFVGL